MMEIINKVLFFINFNYYYYFLSQKKKKWKSLFSVLGRKKDAETIIFKPIVILWQ